MIFFPYLELLASLFILLFCFMIFSRHYENRAARVFGRLALLGFCIAISEYSTRIAFTLDLARGINHIGGALWVFLFPVFTHFCLVFAHKDQELKKPWMFWALYSPAIILAAIYLFTDLLYIRHDIYPFGIANQPSQLYWFFVANIVFYTCWGILAVLGHYRRSLQKTMRGQALLIILGAAIPTTIGLITDAILPLLYGYRPFPPFCVFSIAIMMGFIYLAMRRYALFAISPALAADVIIETMPDSLMVTDLEGRIILLNDEAHRFFKVPKEEILGRPMELLFEERDKYLKLYEEVVVDEKEIERFEANLIDPRGEKISCLINANKMRDALGATLGIVFIIRDING